MSKKDQLKKVLESRNAQSRESYEELKYAQQDVNNFWIHSHQFEEVTDATTLVQKAGLNADEWRCDKFEATSWQVAVKEERNGIKEAVTKNLWRIHAAFKRHVPVHYTEAMRMMVANGNVLKAPTVKLGATKGSHIWILALTDHHFGKLAWGPESGKDYDNTIAKALWQAAVLDQVRVMKAMGISISQIIIPAGNDFFHFDTREGATTAGTPQNCDGRWHRVFSIGCEAFLYAIEACAKVAPVTVLWVPGNHDYLASWWMCEYARAAFAKNRRVTFDNGPDMIKYYQDGKCFFAFSHGQQPSYKALKDMIPVEQSDMWAAGKACREVICGHIHQTKTTNYVGTWEEAGLVFRILPSLAATDYWHKSKGYTTSRHAAQGLVYHTEHGFQHLLQSNMDQLCSQASIQL